MAMPLQPRDSTPRNLCFGKTGTLHKDVWTSRRLSRGPPEIVVKDKENNCLRGGK